MSNTPTSAYDTLLTLIRSATSISDEQKEQYIHALEATDPAQPIAEELRCALQNLCQHEASLLRKDIANSQALMVHVQEISSTEATKNREDEAKVVADAEKEMDAVVGNFQQECVTAEGTFEKRLEKRVGAAEEQEADAIRKKLSEPSKGDQKKAA